MAMAELNDKRFKYDSKSYFVAGSHECQIGCGGEKRSPIGKPKNIDIHRQINPNKIGTLSSNVVEVTLDQKSRSGLNAIIPLQLPSLPIPIDADIVSVGEQLTKGKLKLVHIWAESQALKQAANDSPKLLNDMIDWGHDARLVSEIFIVVEARVAQKFRETKTFGIGKSMAGGLIEARIGGGGGRAGSVDVSLAPGAVFAYLLADPVWDAKARKKRTRIEKLRDDQYGTG